MARGCGHGDGTLRKGWGWPAPTNGIFATDYLNRAQTEPDAFPLRPIDHVE
jgi:hypothetical protein